MTAERLLPILLRVNAGVLLLAAPCALLPFAWMDAVHRDAVGLGSLPDVPITKYMARSLSLVYAMHGVVVLFVTLNWARLRFAVPYLAGLHIVQGCSIFAIGLGAGLPWWWVAVEGPGVVAFACVVLAVYRRACRGEIPGARGAQAP
jgi:hypothetical protein